MVYRSNPEAYWFDDYTELVDEGDLRGSDLLADAGIAGESAEVL